jgi:uroporphyrinogen-III decarboxylase
MTSAQGSRQMKMTKYERVIAALEHKPVDKIPAFLLGADFQFYSQFMNEIGFTVEEMNQYLKDGILDTPPINHAMAIKLGFDCDWYTHISRMHFDSESKQIMDTWGGLNKVFVRDEGIPHLWYGGPGLTTKEKIKKWWDLGRPAGYSDINLSNVKKQIRKLQSSKYDEHVLMVGLSGPYECISMSIGLGQLSKYCRREPEFVREILQHNFEVQAKGLEKICSIKPPVVMCGDDHGFNNGLQMPVTHWREFIKPILGKYVEIVHNHGIKFIMHSCGNIGEIFQDYIDIGIDGVESLQPTINDLPALKSKYGDQIALLGTIDDTNLLVQGSPEQVKKEVTEQLKILSKGSGYIPGATNFLLNQKVKNIQAMVETIHNFNGLQ